MEEILDNNDISNQQLNFLEILSQTYDFDNNLEFIEDNYQDYNHRNFPTVENQRIYRNSQEYFDELAQFFVRRYTRNQNNWCEFKKCKWYNTNRHKYLKYIEKSNDENFLEIKNKNLLCSICLCDFDFDFDVDNQCTDSRYANNICQISCSHYFHEECISQWLDKKKNCPLCREKCLEYYNEKKEFKKKIICPEKINREYHDLYERSDERSRQIIDYLLTTNIFYENIYVPRFGLIYNLKISWYEGTPCAFIIDLFDFDQENLTNPIIKFDLRDIILVIDQAHCNPEKAIESLIIHDSDLINAIMSI